MTLSSLLPAKRIHVSADSIYKGQRLSDLNDRQKREAEAGLRQMYAPRRIKIIYDVA